MQPLFVKGDGVLEGKRIKNYTSIWNVSKYLYSLNDLKLPFAVSYSQIAWFTVSLLLILMFDDVPPLSLLEGGLLKYIVLPAAIAWMANKKTFDHKRPFSFFKAYLGYLVRPKQMYLGKAVKKKSVRVREMITCVRSI